MNKKRVVAAITAGVLTLSMSLTAFAQGKIFVDLEEVKSDTPPQIINDRTMVPVRAISEMLGYDVSWIEDKQQVEVYEKDGTDAVIIMNINNTKAYYTKFNDELGENVGCEAVLDSPATLINDRTFVPLRFISEAVGYQVDYNVDTEDVYMFSPEYMANQGDEGKDDTLAITTDEMDYVLKFTTNSWLELKDDEKLKTATLIIKWWTGNGEIVEVNAEELSATLDHQMEQYFKNKVDEGVFETACDIYKVDVANYIKG